MKNFKWKAGDRFFIYDGSPAPLWGQIVAETDNGEFVVRWKDGAETTETPSPASEWWVKYGNELKKLRTEQ